MKEHTDLGAIFTSILSLKLRAKIWFMAVFGGFTFGSMTAWITHWIYDPYTTYFAIIGLIFADHLTGMAIAWKNSRFETRKALRVFWTVCSHTGLLMFTSTIARDNPVLFWLDEGLIVPIVLVSLLSLIKNLALLGYVKHEVAGMLYRKIDAYKNDYVQIKERPNDVPPADGC
jgi:hypothetical protein